MTGQPIDLAGARLAARASGALWWADQRLLCVADLHLCRSERLARRGGPLLPPYETTETIDRLAAEIDRLAPERVVCLGDSFDDCAAGAALDAAEAASLTALMAGRDWIWIAGNHDPAPLALPGRHLNEYRLHPLTFRHEAAAEPVSGEVSGHYHPKLRLPVRGGAISRPCFLAGGARLILPAFGAYTGGLRADHPVLAALMGPVVLAILTGEPPVALPLARVGRRQGRTADVVKRGLPP